MGDWSFYRMMADLSNARHPLLQVSERTRDSLGVVTPTEAGRTVIECRADQIGLNGIDRWLGGVHLSGHNAQGRWDPASGRLVEQR